jgi:vacuolar-type H+-ATPase subunit F/Vma7
MEPIVVIGDELTCAGFRLSGVATRTPAAGEAGAVLARALGEARLVVLTQALADGVEPGLLHQALAREQPLLVVMPGIAEPDALSDLSHRTRVLLGIDS